MSVLTTRLDAPDPLEAALNRAGAVFVELDGRRSVVNYGSAAGELAVCVSGVGLVDRSALDKLVLEAPSAQLDDLIARLTGGTLAVGGALTSDGYGGAGSPPTACCCSPSPVAGPRARAQLRQLLLHHPSLTIEDRSEEWAAIEVIGRAAAQVLNALGAYGEAGDPRSVAPFAPGSVDGVAVTWLHECDRRALAVVAREAAGLVWQTIEAAGRPYGISCVGHEAANRYRLLERADEHRRRSSEPAALRRLLAELQQLEREIVELEYVRRSDALERVRDAVRRLGEVGSPEGILDRAAEELGSSSQFDRVLISEVDNQSLRPRTIWAREDPAAAASALAELRTHRSGSSIRWSRTRSLADSASRSSPWPRRARAPRLRSSTRSAGTPTSSQR